MSNPYEPKRAKAPVPPKLKSGGKPSRGPKKGRPVGKARPVRANVKKPVKIKPVKMKGIGEEHSEMLHLYAHLRHISARDVKAEGKRRMEELRQDAEKRLMQHTAQVEADTSRIIGQVWKSKLPPSEKEGFLRQAKEVLAHEHQKMAHMEKGWLSKPAKKSLKQSEKRLKKEISAIDSQISKLRKAA
jgi:hypothetical protein